MRLKSWLGAECHMTHRCSVHLSTKPMIGASTEDEEVEERVGGSETGKLKFSNRRPWSTELTWVSEPQFHGLINC